MTQHAYLPSDKQAIREHVWQALTEAGVAPFPGAWGRIPNFEGVAQAAAQLSSLEVWQRAHDIPLDCIATPEALIRCHHAYPRPQGIYWELLTADMIPALPILRKLHGTGVASICWPAL